MLYECCHRQARWPTHPIWFFPGYGTSIQRGDVLDHTGNRFVLEGLAGPLTSVLYPDHSQHVRYNDRRPTRKDCHRWIVSLDIWIV